MLPDAGRANVNHLDGLLNSMLLIELVKRAESGMPLLPGIQQLYAKAQRELPAIMRREGGLRGTLRLGSRNFSPWHYFILRHHCVDRVIVRPRPLDGSLEFFEELLRQQ